MKETRLQKTFQMLWNFKILFGGLVVWFFQEFIQGDVLLLFSCSGGGLFVWEGMFVFFSFFLIHIYDGGETQTGSCSRQLISNQRIKDATGHFSNTKQ